MEQDYENQFDYQAQPAAIKFKYTARQWAWLGNEDRERAIERETQPDYDCPE